MASVKGIPGGSICTLFAKFHLNKPQDFNAIWVNVKNEDVWLKGSLLVKTKYT